LKKQAKNNIQYATIQIGRTLINSVYYPFCCAIRVPNSKKIIEYYTEAKTQDEFVQVSFSELAECLLKYKEYLVNTPKPSVTGHQKFNKA